MAVSDRMLTHVASVLRQVKTGNVYAAATHATGVRGSLQPLTNKTALEYSMIPGKAFAFYTNATDFKKTDLLEVNSVKYVVREVTIFMDFGAIDHTMVLLEKAA